MQHLSLRSAAPFLCVRLLVTSRTPIRKMEDVGEKVIPLRPLDNRSAAELFVRRAPRQLRLQEMLGQRPTVELSAAASPFDVFADGSIVTALGE